METKIALPRLAQYLSDTTGKPRRICEEFLKELFRIIADELEKGESIRIKGFGTFKLVDVETRKSVDVSTGDENEIPAHKKVIFVASKEVAAKVNSPFEAFETIEVSDDIPTDLLTAGDLSEDIANEEFNVSGLSPYTLVKPTSIAAEEEKAEDEEIKETEAEDVPEEASEDTTVDVSEDEEMISEDEDLTTEKDTDLPSDDVPQDGKIPSDEAESSSEEEDLTTEEEDEPEKKSRKFGWGFVIGFVSAVILAMAGLVVWFGVDIFKDPNGFLASWSKPGTNNNTETTIPGTAAPNTDNLTDSLVERGDLQDEVPTQASDQLVYDTISNTRFLTTMAKAHYGNFNLWPIIYEENKGILGHPDRIRPGTRVVVPPLKKYGVDPSNPTDVEKMKKKGDEIYSRY